MAADAPAQAEQSGQAIAVCVGLNAVDPGHYAGWSGKLVGCEPDARDMAQIGQQNGFDVRTLLTKEATRDAVLAAIRGAAAKLRAGGVFMLTYSGHGGQVVDQNGDEADGLDETWCLYDGQLIDDELYAEFGKFTQGVRILVFSDSCHSGTIAKVKPEDLKAAAEGRLRDYKAYESRIEEEVKRDRIARPKAMPTNVMIDTYVKNQAFYDRIGKSVTGEGKGEKLKASVLTLAACKDDELSGDGDENGVFTGALKAVWGGGNFQGNYGAFHGKIRDRASVANPGQTAQKTMIDEPNEPFEAQRPFATQSP